MENFFWMENVPHRLMMKVEHLKMYNFTLECHSVDVTSIFIEEYSLFDYFLIQQLFVHFLSDFVVWEKNPAVLASIV